MATVKVTKKDVLNAINILVAGEKDEAVLVEDSLVTVADVKAYVATTLAQLEKKAETAAAKAAAKKAAGDELRAAVEAVLTDELQTNAEILAQIEGEDLTPNKITARLTQLVKAGIATKEKIKVDGKEKMAYRLAGEAEDAEDSFEDEAE